MLLFPILLNMLRSRIPRLLDTPALLAHNIYQTVVFDDTVRENGFDVAGVSVNEGKDTAEWEGLAEVILREEGWFDRWLAGEKKCELIRGKRIGPSHYSRGGTAARHHCVARCMEHLGRSRRRRGPLGRLKGHNELATGQGAHRAGHR